jgi:hypothetical protein
MMQIDSGARALANMNRPKKSDNSPGVTNVADKAGVAGAIGLPGSGAAYGEGNIFVFASQSGAVDITVDDGLVVGQLMYVTQLKGAANAITLKDSAAATIATLTTAAGVSSSVLLIWNGTTWVPVLFGAGAA